MMNNFYSNYGAGFGASTWVHTFGPLLAIFVLWSVLWKGLALWHSARRGQPWWFIILLIVNTAGILEIVYLFLILKVKSKELFKK